MKIMDTTNIQKCYAISTHLCIPYIDVKTFDSEEIDYLYNIVKNSLITGRFPSDTLCAEYKQSNGKLFIVSEEEISWWDEKASNINEPIDIVIKYNVLSFNPNYISTSTFNTDYSVQQEIYIKDEDKFKITKKDKIFIEIFDKMFEVVTNKSIDAFELGGKYNMVKIVKYASKRT